MYIPVVLFILKKHFLCSTGVNSVGLPNQSWTNKRQHHLLHSGQFRALQH